MSYVDRIVEANPSSRLQRIPFVVDQTLIGSVNPTFMSALLEWPEVFVPVGPGTNPTGLQQSRLGIAESLVEASVAERSEAVRSVLATLRDRGQITGWRDEAYAVNRDWGEPACLLMERAAVPLFGIRGYGVHLNGYVHTDQGVKLWVAKRSDTKPTDPGKFDQLVAGGQPAGLSLFANLCKECEEEAAIPGPLSAQARSVGTIAYTYRDERTMRPDVLFCYDLELPPDFEPRNNDGEVAAFELWDLDRVDAVVAGSSQFKFNCALVVIDFLIRHGHISPEHPDYLWLCRALRGLPSAGEI